MKGTDVNNGKNKTLWYGIEEMHYLYLEHSPLQNFFLNLDLKRAWMLCTLSLQSLQSANAGSIYFVNDHNPFRNWLFYWDECANGGGTAQRAEVASYKWSWLSISPWCKSDGLIGLLRDSSGLIPPAAILNRIEIKSFNKPPTNSALCVNCATP